MPSKASCTSTKHPKPGIRGQTYVNLLQAPAPIPTTNLVLSRLSSWKIKMAGGQETHGSSLIWPSQNPVAHLVALVTGYHCAFGLKMEKQHLLPGAKHAFPQHPPPCPWHGKEYPTAFSQQRSPPAHSNDAPCRFVQITGGKRLRDSVSCSARRANNELSSLLHSPSAAHSSSPRAAAEVHKSKAIAETRVNAMGDNNRF